MAKNPDNEPQLVEEAGGLRKIKPLYMILAGVALVAILGIAAVLLPGLLGSNNSTETSLVARPGGGSSTVTSATPTPSPSASMLTGSKTKDPFKPLVSDNTESTVVTSAAPGTGTTDTGSTTTTTTTTTSPGATVPTTSSTSETNPSSGTSGSTSTGSTTGSGTGSTTGSSGGTTGSSGGTSTSSHYVQLLEVGKSATTGRTGVRADVAGRVVSIFVGGSVTVDGYTVTLVSASAASTITKASDEKATFSDAKGQFTEVQGQFKLR